MKRIVCELCGSSDVVKQDGAFVCQECGCKYTLEEARKLMVDVPDDEAAGKDLPAAAPAPASAQEDLTKKIENYLTLANTAIGSNNNKEAEEYANKIIELDPCCARAWFIKGKAAGWQSTLANVRFNEALDCFAKALENVNEEDKEALKTDIGNEASNLMKALVNLRADNFGRYPDANNATGLIKSATTMLVTIGQLIVKTGIWLDSDELSDYAATRMNIAAVAGSNTASKRFGPNASDQNKFAYNTWLEQTDRCITVLEAAASVAAKEDTVRKIYSNLRILQKNMVDSCSYKFQADGYTTRYVVDTTLTDQAKAIRNSAISSYAQKENQKLMVIRKKQQEKEAARARDYWAQHADEKASLDEEKQGLEEKKTDLDTQVKTLELRKQNVPAAAEETKLMDEIRALTTKREGLGLFKGKEKKMLQEQIDALNTKLSEARTRKKEQEGDVEKLLAPVRTELRKAAARIKEITDKIEHP